MRNNFNNNSFPNFEQFISSFKNDNSTPNNNDNSNVSNMSSDSEFNPFGNIDINTILKAKQIMDNMNKNQSNPRANLLLSLKPYLNSNRRKKVDDYIKLFNMTELIESLKSSGGENIK